MSLSTSTLAAIQKVGSAAFTADEKLKKEVEAYAERVSAAISKNAYNLGNDTLIENWKVVARLSQTLAGIEAELKKVFQVASELMADDQPTVRDVPMLPAPVKSASKAASKVKKVAVTPVTVKANSKKTAAKPVAPVVVTPKKAVKKSVASSADLTPVDVVVKSTKKAATPKVKVSKPKATGASDKSAVPVGNAAKLLAYFERTLNSNEFSAVSQTVASQETGIPLGSMTASIKKLTETGCITAAPDGGLKLVVTQPTPVPTLEAK
ncbi:MAG: hypothetical protein FD135_923 [Comamonadaceae bacterium]|nr:MAG: hypothetical protein FD135_923 [Comamonadaceae bacterium]